MNLVLLFGSDWRFKISKINIRSNSENVVVHNEFRPQPPTKPQKSYPLQAGRSRSVLFYEKDLHESRISAACTL
jgi:hypothetical protein